jgi:hypothetical protein
MLAFHHCMTCNPKHRHLSLFGHNPPPVIHPIICHFKYHCCKYKKQVKWICKLSCPKSMNYIKDQDHHWVFHVAIYFLNTSLLCLDAFYIYQKFMSSYTVNILIANSIEPKWLDLDVWWFKILAPVEFKDPPCVRGPIRPSKPQIQKSQNNLAPLAKMAKYRCLVLWNRGPYGTIRSPTRWRAISTFEASNSKHPQKNLALWAKMA